MNSNFSRRGQAQHLFNDLIPGIIFAVVGIILLSLVVSNHNDQLRRDVDDRLFEQYGERQLLQFLQTRVQHLGTHKDVWQLLYEAQDHGDWLRSPAELSGTPTYGAFAGDASLITVPAGLVFQPLFDQGMWQLFVAYEDLPYEVAINSRPGFSSECALYYKGKNHLSKGKDYRSEVQIPGEHGMTVSLSYCLPGGEL